MKTLIRIAILLLVIGVTVGIASTLVSNWWRKRQIPNWRTEPVVIGDVKSVVNSTGTIKPVMSVQIGSFVSGPIDPETPLVEFNQEVKKGDVLAIIDQRLYKADVARDRAAVQAAEASQEAAIASVQASNAAVDAARASYNTRLAEVERSRAEPQAR